MSGMSTDEISSLTYTAELPLAWHEQAPPSPATLALWRHANLALLRGLATMESFVPPESEAPADAATAKALERVEAKLDLALGLLARLLAERGELPPALPVTLGTSRVSWRVAGLAELAPGSELLLQLYLSPRLPEPLRLWARVGQVQPGGAETLYEAELLERDVEFDEWLTRTLFRYHRRALQSRHAAP